MIHSRRTLIGIGCVVLTGVVLQVFRSVYFEPRAMGLACLHGTGPAAVCAARSVLGLATYYQVVGAVALLTGVAAMAGAGFATAVAAVCWGVAGLIDYNVSWGMLGTAMGVWAWLSASKEA